LTHRHEDYCPFKGQAAYFSLKGGPEKRADHENPYDKDAAIKDCRLLSNKSIRSRR